MVKVNAKIKKHIDKGWADTKTPVYYFIKRNSTTHEPNLSKPYRSPMSATYARSLHYLTEYTTELPDAYCTVATMVGTGYKILKEIIKEYPDIKITKVNDLKDNYRIISHKLGVTKEDAHKMCGSNKIKADNPIMPMKASLYDEISKKLNRDDTTLRVCMVAAAYGYDPKGAKHHTLKAQCFE